MLEDIIAVLLNADRVIIPFERLRGALHVDVIVAVNGDEHSCFEFEDDWMLIQSTRESAQIAAALWSQRELVELLRPIEVEALVTWTVTETGATAAVRGMTLSGEAGARAELSRVGAVYTYSMALVSAPTEDRTSA